MHGVDRQRGIDMAMIIDDEAGRRHARANAVDVKNRPTLRRPRGQRLANGVALLNRGVKAGEFLHGQRLDMGLDFDLAAELRSDGRFERTRQLMRDQSRMRPSSSTSRLTDLPPSTSCTVM